MAFKNLITGIAGLAAAAKAVSQAKNKTNGSTAAGGTQSSKTQTGSGGSSGGKYTPIDTSGNDYGAMMGMTAAEQAAIKAAQASYEAHKASGNKAGMDAAHQQAEAIRQKYSYSGGGDGSQYLPFQQLLQQQAPEYDSRYDGYVQDGLQGILNRDPFSYNYLDDPLYQQYANVYNREGQRAMQDTLGQVAARTGGIASSYATSAADQANNYYMSQLGDKIPELQQLAYSMYMDDVDADYRKMSLLQQLESMDYGKYQDSLSQWNTDRNFNYGVHRDNVSDSRYEKEWDYGVGRDEVSDSRYEDETEYEWALRKAQTLAQSGDFSGYSDIGFSESEIAGMIAGWQRQQAASGNTSSGGRSSGNRTSSTSSGDIYQQLYSMGVQSEGQAYAMLLSQGYSSTEAGRIAGYYMNDLEGGKFGGGSESYVMVDGERIAESKIDEMIRMGVLHETVDKQGNITVHRNTLNGVY